VFSSQAYCAKNDGNYLQIWKKNFLFEMWRLAVNEARMGLTWEEARIPEVKK